MIANTKPITGLELDPIPPAPEQLQRLMLATTVLVDGHVEPMPERSHPALTNSLVMPLAGLILVGTRCDRPMMIREVRNVANGFGRDAIIVRAKEAIGHASYRLWIAPLSGSTWLIPSAGETTYIRLGAFGVEAVGQAPFLDEVERHRGIRHATELLSVAVRGWF
jgi:hypothetical protein